MKKHFTVRSIGWSVVLFEAVLCTVFALGVLLVNGADSWNDDHNSLTLLIILTLASVVLMKSGKRFLHKAVLGIAALPLLAIGYEAMVTFLTPAHAEPFLQGHQLLASLFVF